MLMPDALSRAKLARAARVLNQGRLILMTDDQRPADPVSAARRLPRGSLVILRARDPRHRAALAAQMKPIARARGLLLLIADDPGLARAVGASGVHLPQIHARQAGHLRAANPHWLITAAAHSLKAALAASHADVLLLSPVFATQSHAQAMPLTPARARLIARGLKSPVFALGGVTAANAAQLSGFSGLAAIGALA
jgi:thiamine-phosphate pyrophosphorylase